MQQGESEAIKGSFFSFTLQYFFLWNPQGPFSRQERKHFKEVTESGPSKSSPVHVTSPDLFRYPMKRPSKVMAAP